MMLARKKDISHKTQISGHLPLLQSHPHRQLNFIQCDFSFVLICREPHRLIRHNCSHGASLWQQDLKNASIVGVLVLADARGAAKCVQRHWFSHFILIFMIFILTFVGNFVSIILVQVPLPASRTPKGFSIELFNKTSWRGCNYEWYL